MANSLDKILKLSKLKQLNYGDQQWNYDEEMDHLNEINLQLFIQNIKIKIKEIYDRLH